MNTITTTIAARASRHDGDRHLRRGFGVAILVAALVSATACGGDTTTDAAGTIVPASTSTTTAPPVSSMVNAPPTDPTTTSTTTTARPTSTTEPRPTTTRDELVGSAGERVHVRCTGSGATTVLLIAGFETGAEGWGRIEPAIAARARTCSYERLGTGTSDPATSTQTFTTQASGLHELLTSIGEPGPYVVVGHSFGGAAATTFASLYSDEVTGLVLVDAPAVTWPTALCAVPDDGSETAATLRSFCASFSDPTTNAEHLDVLASFAEVADIVSLGSLPMTVITAVDRQFSGLAANELARLTEEWDQGQRDWIGLSTAARLVSVDNTGHHIEIDQPAVVIDEITRLLP